MGVTLQEGPLIAQGYPYSLRLEASSPVFSASHAYKAQFRVKPAATSALAEITTGSGITYVSPTALDFLIPAGATASFPLGEVWTDLVRTDVSPNLFMGFQFSIPVILPVTRSP